MYDSFSVQILELRFYWSEEFKFSMMNETLLPRKGPRIQVFCDVSSCQEIRKKPKKLLLERMLILLNLHSILLS